MEVVCKRREGLNGVRVPIGRHSHVVFAGATVNPSDIRIDALQHGRGYAGLAPATVVRLSHQTLLSLMSGIREQGGDMTAFS